MAGFIGLDQEGNAIVQAGEGKKVLLDGPILNLNKPVYYQAAHYGTIQQIANLQSVDPVLFGLLITDYSIGETVLVMGNASPDGIAAVSAIHNGVYFISNIISGKLVLTIHPSFNSDNDVQNGRKFEIERGILTGKAFKYHGIKNGVKGTSPIQFIQDDTADEMSYISSNPEYADIKNVKEAIDRNIKFIERAREEAFEDHLVKVRLFSDAAIPSTMAEHEKLYIEKTYSGTTFLAHKSKIMRYKGTGSTSVTGNYEQMSPKDGARIYDQQQKTKIFVFDEALGDHQEKEYGGLTQTQSEELIKDKYIAHHVAHEYQATEAYSLRDMVWLDDPTGNRRQLHVAKGTVAPGQSPSLTGDTAQWKIMAEIGPTGKISYFVPQHFHEELELVKRVTFHAEMLRDMQTTPAAPPAGKIHEWAHDALKRSVSMDSSGNIYAMLELANTVYYELATKLSTVGDMYVHDGAKLAKLPPGTTGQVLKRDDTKPLKVDWQAEAGGGATVKEFQTVATELTANNSSTGITINKKPTANIDLIIEGVKLKLGFTAGAADWEVRDSTGVLRTSLSAIQVNDIIHVNPIVMGFPFESTMEAHVYIR